MPIKNAAYAAHSETEPLRPWQYEIRDPKPDECVIEVHYCGICHSDIHSARSEWRKNIYPLVPGHEFTGVISKIGEKVTKHKVGDKVAVGVSINSCRTCGECQRQCENYCAKKVVAYGTVFPDGYRTQGAYGRIMVVNEDFINHLPEALPMDRAAPLMCAGVTMYSPMKHNGLHNGGKKVGIVGIGGLGHLAVQFAAAWGNEVIAISRSNKKEAFAKQLGAKRVLVSSDADAMAAEVRTFDYILDTTSAHRDLTPFIELLKVDGIYQLAGLPPSDKPLDFPLFSCIMARRSIQGSLIGSPSESQEMLNFCAERNILPLCEMTTEDKINECYERVIKGDVLFRFVLDVKNSAPAIEN